MKRFLSTISLLLTVVMLTAFAAPLSVLAADAPVYGTAADFALNNSDKVNVVYAPELSGNSADNLAKVDGILSESDPWYDYSFTIPGTEVLTIWPSSGDTLTIANTLIAGMSTDYRYTQDDKYIYIAIATHLNAQTIGGVKYVPHIFQENLYLGLNKGFDTFSTSDKVSGMYDAFRYEGGTGIETLEPNFDLGGYGTVKKIVASRYTADGKTLIKPYDENYVVGKQHKNGAREYMKDSYILYREIVIEKNQNKLPSTLSIRLDVNPFDYLPNSDREQTPVDLGYNFNLTGTNVTNDAELLAAAATAGVAPTVANNYKYFNDLIILDDKNTEATELGHTTTNAFIANGPSASETEGTATFYHSHKIADNDSWNVIDLRKFDATYTKNGDAYTYTQITSTQSNTTHHWEGCSCGAIIGERTLHDDGSYGDDCTKDVLCQCGAVILAAKLNHEAEKEQDDVTVPVKCKYCTTIVHKAYAYGAGVDFALDNSDKLNVIYAPQLSGAPEDNLARVDGILDPNDPWYNYTFTIPGTDVLTIWPSSGDTLTIANTLIDGMSTDYHYTQDDKYIYIAIATRLNAQTIGGVKYVPHILIENLYLGLNTGLEALPASTNKVCTLYDAFRYEGGTGIETYEPNFNLDGYGTVKKVVTSRYTADGKTLIAPYSDYIVPKWYSNGAREYMKDSYILYREIVIEKNQENLPSNLSIRLDVNTLDYLPDSDTNKTPEGLGYNFNLTGIDVTNDAELLAAAATAGVAPATASTFKWFNDIVILNNRMDNEVVEHTCDEKFLVSEDSTDFYHSTAIKNVDGKADWKVIYPGTFVAENTADGYVFSNESYNVEATYDVTLTESDADNAHSCENDGLYFKSCSCGIICDDTDKMFTVYALTHDEATKHLESNEVEHWFACDKCNGVGSKTEEHSFDREIAAPAYLKPEDEVTCQTTYYKSCVCGVSSTNEEDTFKVSIDDVSLHDYSEKYLYNELYHWKECTRCGATNMPTYHTFNGVSCTLCNYKKVSVPSTPTTEAPTTEAPTTEAPTTEAPTTEAPTTEAPTTEAPTTEAPTTEAPATEAPATEALTTEAPATEALTTEPVDGGCGSSVSFVALALVATLGTCTAFVAKKKED